MPEPTFRDLCDLLQDRVPTLSRSRVKRVVAQHLIPCEQKRSVADLLELGYYLMHSDPTGEEATNK